MLKIVAVGVWVLVVTLAASYGVARYVVPEPARAETEPSYFEGLDYKKTTNITVPMIDAEAIRGYILAQFIYTVDGAQANEIAVPPDAFVLDEAFRRIYHAGGFDFDNPERYDLEALLGRIREAVNERYGEKIVHDVMVEQFDFIPRDKIRGRRPEGG